ncbi:hypothetical protein KHA90_24545 [Flavobacterium psychroterrae]|uniref:Lipoprotein n=1 Tax=Flavobacterium psychroterrae TaxID=2133767 RepID=A0ABS5PKJ6_9FLAO|nr:hypothetical protein [Flavobacterium psychroterrae]MBS7234175.1 hypothetical protein [Flavobacterium psychroterrae]
MKNIKIGCLFLVLTMFLVSCAGKKPVVVQNTTTIEKVITETIHDTVLTVQKDSSSYNALLECINGKVAIKSVTQAEPGRNLKSPKVRIADNVLTVDCEAKAQELFLRWKSTYITEHKQEIKEVPIITNVLTWRQETQIKGFWFLVSILTLIIIAFIKTTFKKTI